MASSTGKRSTGKKGSSGGNGRAGSAGRITASGTTAAAKRKIDPQQAAKDSAMYHEIGLIVLFVVMVFLFCCNFGIMGAVGNAVSGFLFGLFGLTAYLAPVLVFLALAFWTANQGSPTAVRKLLAGVVLFLMLGVLCELFGGNIRNMTEGYALKEIYSFCREHKNGGGILAGSFAYLFYHYLEMIGTILVVILFSVISFILLTERSVLDSVRNGSARIRERSQEDAEYRRELAEQRREEQENQRMAREEERHRRAEEREEVKRLKTEKKENEKILRMDKKVTGVSSDTVIKSPAEGGRDRIKRNDVHEITYSGEEEQNDTSFRAEREISQSAPHTIRQQSYEDLPEPNIAGRRRAEVSNQTGEHLSAEAAVNAADAEMAAMRERMEKQAERDRIARNAEPQKQFAGERPEGMPLSREAEQIQVHKEGIGDGASHGAAGYQNPAPVNRAASGNGSDGANMSGEIRQAEKKVPKTYMFPPLSRLQKGASSSADNSAELKETALRLRDTLHTFGVNVTITDISQGPSVTRYELQPEQGVKVSKIVGLADDIKLNLAATDIRIEAPIPGKAAIGIEVPNKENMMVALRDLLESKQFQEFDSKLAFAVGKDIAGQTVVADIAKMPHMLIAGSTGSGKSVCINTLIMSILYKAHPDDVKLIMVDPKVVELSVYNGIPHLLIPVVTDPKKASAALHWAVSEMEDRYRKFADYNVRDLKGYNKKLESLRDSGESDVPDKLPQIVIIVDELADLMMVSPGEVEESICRLAQLARACGIHLIIATQRPSVDVITGLIKANMPSRVAFAVSSGTDSRTILDMVGAEKLLGKGDMLFYPQGYSKPARIQGAFVSDKEVSDVVDFLKNQMIGNVYAEDIEEKIRSMGSGGPAGGGSGGSGSGLDEYFEEAGRFIIDKDKASIGMLQRVLKVGFNRAARIMDQLCEYGVVGEEEGTKPRKILMTLEQFEQLLEEI